MVSTTPTQIRVAPVLDGAFPLNVETIWTVVPNAQPGAYVLSRDGKHANFIGRSDEDVRSRLLDHAGLDGYVYFWYTYASSAREAFNLESLLFHQYGEGLLLDNWRHPERAPGTTWRCPACDYY